MLKVHRPGGFPHVYIFLIEERPLSDYTDKGALFFRASARGAGGNSMDGINQYGSWPRGEKVIIIIKKDTSQVEGQQPAGSPVDQADGSLIGDAFGKTKKKIGEVIDPDLYHDKIAISLKDPSYKNIKSDEAAAMIGYFTKKMRDAGFPWKLCKVEGKDLKKREEIGQMEALERLEKGKEVLFQPERFVKFEINPEGLTAVSKIGGAHLQPVGDVAAMSKDTKLSATNEKAVTFGAPIMVKGLGELKLLYQMYNPDVKVEEKNALGKAAHNLSFFTKKVLDTNFPFRFVKETGENTFLRTLRAAFHSAMPGLVVGAGVGLAIGGPIGLLTGAWATTMTIIGYGAAIGAGLRSVDAARAAVKGEEINAFETLGRVLDHNPVLFQERQKHSINLPILGTYTWYTDFGKGSMINSPEKLETFNKMNNQT
jgi:hypothetical protein